MTVFRKIRVFARRGRGDHFHYACSLFERRFFRGCGQWDQ